ncbi:maleylpyruvate isomerase family mycothiol-dependent enzyme [Actinomycetospora sp. CA-101289]|uniref:maleylpyruvate isomerase family mycothiol-dependent enzyme n=1 Tax=Actinomycetospora sp. CA-101289 TaxID=3239893 RepID=UPI003D99221F
MDRDDLRTALESERLRLADVVETLGPEEWRTPSLCTGWTVQDVVAHITLTSRLTKLGAIRAMLAARGRINRMIDESARARAAQFSPAELVAQLRETAGSERRPLGAKPMDPLVDILVHGQDINRPLHRTYPMTVEYVVPALGFVVGTKFYGAPKRLAGLRLVATDADWSTGSASDREVRGPVGELLLVATGRPAGLPALSGDGAEELAARLSD